MLNPGETAWQTKCALQIEQANVDVILEEDVEVLFEVVGKKYVSVLFRTVCMR